MLQVHEAGSATILNPDAAAAATGSQDISGLVETALKRPRHRLRLGRDIDARYEASTSLGRVAGQKRMLAMFYALYASAIGLDIMLGAQDVGLRLRFGITAPLVLVCGLLLSARQSESIQGILGSLPVLTMVATTQIIGLHLGDIFAQRYMFAASLLALHVNISYGQRWPWTATAAIGNSILVWCVLVSVRGWSGTVAFADLASFNSVIMVGTLYWSFHSEQARRDAFLYDLLADINAETLRKANSELQKLSLTDSLTDLPNRRAFDQEFGRAWLHAQQTQQALGFLLIDIDHFKAFNDSAGHLAGDACLQQVAGVIRRALTEPGAFPARYGGEEFAVVLPGSDAAATRAVAERLKVAVNGSGIINPGRSGAEPLTISVGFASTRKGLMNTTAMLRSADDGLYRAKGLGRNCVASAEDDRAASAAA